MVLHLCHGIVAEGWGLRNAVFRTGEIEDIRITGETPVLETRDIKTQEPAILITQTRGLGESITQSVVEKWGVVTI